MKKLCFITIGDKLIFDSHIRNNRYRNIADNVKFAASIGYRASRSNVHRYMQKLKREDNG
ncbi:hypothetical protein GXV23_005138 [Escherichia coli]|nr:hypothetical protein UMNF18_987 [Escherichia coli UMNF18]EAY6134628.1 hypothetical protein [Salmonella enterica]EBZ2217602.1 hypothetical protein [Salmonella enterica subsp. enterica serovar Montevideo]ECA5181393.1 hypothetical protein [Salmonella enterica subsp. enterica serovar Newport]EFB3245979.1 hypothetical protein [Escherichia coli]EFW0444733.1 hypothetical protein [Shigella boydii]EII47402.1 hypothetical protein EC23916_2851 [Escherichia coli 2.3916]